MMFLRRTVFKQFLKFGFVGVESTILNYLVFLVFFGILSLNYLLAAEMGFFAGVFFGFAFNKFFTFQSNKQVKKTLPKYVFVYTINLFFNILFLAFLVESLSFSPIYANLSIAPLIIIMNFFGTKLIAFQDKRW